MDSVGSTKAAVEQLAAVLSSSLRVWNEGRKSTASLRLEALNAQASLHTAAEVVLRASTVLSASSVQEHSSTQSDLALVRKEAAALQQGLLAKCAEVKAADKAARASCCSAEAVSLNLSAVDHTADLRQLVGAFGQAVTALHINTDAIRASLLSAGVVDFYQRPLEFQSICEHITSGANMVLVHGEPGIGKTALLEHFHDCIAASKQPGDKHNLLQRADNPPAVLALARRFMAGAVLFAVGSCIDREDSREAFLLNKLRSLVRALDCDADVDAVNTLQDAGEQLQQIAARAPLLVLVDDVREEDRALLHVLATVFDGRGGSACIATSRSLDGVGGAVTAVECRAGGASSISEAVLTSRACNDPFATRLPPSLQEVGEKMLAACGPNPLVLKLMGTLLQPTPRSTDWEDALRDFDVALKAFQSAEDAQCMAAYAIVCGRLSEGARMLAGQLQLFHAAARVPVEALQAVWGANHPSAKDDFSYLLKTLELAGLVDVHRGAHAGQADTVSFHSLFARFSAVSVASGARVCLPSPAVPQLQQSSIAAGTHRTLQDAGNSESVPAVAALALFGNPQTRAAVTAALGALASPPASERCDWWATALGNGFHPTALFSALASDNKAGTYAAARALLLSAACKRVWPDLPALVPTLLRSTATVLGGVAFTAGVRGHFRWSQAATDALEDLARTAATSESNAALLRQVGGQAMDLGAVEAALVAQRRVLEMHKELHGEGDVGVAGVLEEYGVMMAAVGRYEEALRKGERALAIRRALLGEEHEDTATAYEMVAGTLCNLGRFEDALRHDEAALGIWRAALGEEHVTTARCLDSVGTTLHNLGWYEDALRLKRRALEIRRRVLGEGHSQTARSYDSVGSTLCNLGRYDEALQHDERALDIRRRVLGDLHDETADSFDSLSTTLNNLGKHEAAVAQAQRALDIRREVLGECHVNTGRSMRSVAITLANVNKRSEGLALLRQASGVLAAALGPRHPEASRAAQECRLVASVAAAAH